MCRRGVNIFPTMCGPLRDPEVQLLDPFEPARQRKLDPPPNPRAPIKTSGTGLALTGTGDVACFSHFSTGFGEMGDYVELD